ncbi:MAG: THUMP domain-containing class I SAM-dependent RNA methyltransferase [Bacteroidales bacterium]
MSRVKHTIVAKTMAGLEPVLKRELEAIGAEEAEAINRAVIFKGDNEVLYKANYWPYTALRILKIIDEFDVKDENDLYNKIKRIKWYKLMDLDGTLAIDTFLHNSTMTHSRFVSQKIKDAIVDQFRDMFERRPSVDTENPELRINVHINKNHCTISLDSSGDSLHKRGYRQETNKAPINEVLAAGMLKLAGYDGNQNLLDPMCGSGTILIEAALMASNMPSAFYREEFGFFKWMDFEPLLWRQIKKEAFQFQKDPEGEIVGFDMNQNTITKAKANAKFAKLHHDIEFRQIEFSQSSKPFNEGLIVMNPPYGERMKMQNMDEFYKMVGDTLKTEYKGFNAFIISSDIEAIKHIGLKTSEKHILYNGALECRFNKYELYEGSRKTVKEEE